MPPTSSCNRPKPHEVFVIFGLAAVIAYEEGELSYKILSELGCVKRYCFTNLSQLNGFIFGIEEASMVGHLLPVDDLEEYDDGNQAREVSEAG